MRANFESLVMTRLGALKLWLWRSTACRVGAADSGGPALRQTACLLTLLVTAAHGAALSQGTAVSESALKSALFFKLPQFVYRPNEAHDRPLSICLLGSHVFNAAFEKLARLPIDGRGVKYSKLGAAAQASRCDFVVISQNEASGLAALLRHLTTPPMVTLSDIAGFARAGGMVELSLGGGGAPVNILINRKAARLQDIAFNAQLLRLARVVRP